MMQRILQTSKVQKNKTHSIRVQLTALALTAFCLLSFKVMALSQHQEVSGVLLSKTTQEQLSIQNMSNNHQRVFISGESYSIKPLSSLTLSCQSKQKIEVVLSNSKRNLNVECSSNIVINGLHSAYR